MSTICVRMPKYPECWSSCGSCASGNVFILELLVKAGDLVARDDNILTLETGKVALDIPTPYAGRVIDSASNERHAGLPLADLAHTHIIGVAGGAEKVLAIRSALRGRLVSGLITDERTAEAVLQAGKGLD